MPLHEGGPMELYTPLGEKMPRTTNTTAEGQNRRRKSNTVKDPEAIANMQFVSDASNIRILLFIIPANRFSSHNPETPCAKPSIPARLSRAQGETSQKRGEPAAQSPGPTPRSPAVV